MNENETDPRSADASPESSSPEPGQSEQPTTAHASADVPAAAPSGVPESGAPQSVAPQSVAPLPVGQWGPQQPQQSPWQQPHPTAQMPYGQHPGYNAYQQSPYGQQHPGYQQYAQQSAYSTWAQQNSGQPGAEGQPPSWVHPVGADTQTPPRSGRNRRILVAGAVAVLIALGAGGVGAATALAFDNNGSSPTIKTGNSSVTRVVDRSSLAQIASAVQDSVVSITTESGEGSGVILSADGYIVTNNHVVATATGSTVTVIFADGKKATANIVGTDTRDDLAVVKATGVSGLKAATFGSSAKMEVGDTVLAIGSPLGLEGSVTAGIISAKDRTIQSSSQDQQQQQQSPLGQQQQGGNSGSSGTSTTMSGLLQTDAPINPGNSGGALVNTNGEVIGINSAIATQGSSSGNIGLGFAIPSDKASSIAKDLMAGKQPAHPALGVSVTDSENGGALVSNVTASSAAAKAGLQQGDVITAVDGKAVNSADDLVAAVQGASVGQKMTIEFTRNGAKKTASVTLAEAK